MNLEQGAEPVRRASYYLQKVGKGHQELVKSEKRHYEARKKGAVRWEEVGDHG
jgi:hypothetical protein